MCAENGLELNFWGPSRSTTLWTSGNVWAVAHTLSGLLGILGGPSARWPMHPSFFSSLEPWGFEDDSVSLFASQSMRYGVFLIFIPKFIWSSITSWSWSAYEASSVPVWHFSWTISSLLNAPSPHPPSLTWNLKQIWMGRMKLIVNIILFPLLRPRPCLRRLKDVGSCDLKKIFPLRTIVSVLSSEFWLGKLEGQHWPVLCFYISVLTTCPRATSMQCCSCLDWEPWCGRSISKSFNVS